MRGKNFFTQSGSVAIVALVILSIVAGATVFYKKSGSKPKSAPGAVPQSQPLSAPGVPTISFATDPEAPSPGGSFDLILKVNPNGAEFHAFELYTDFEAAKVEIQGNIISNYPLIIAKADPSSRKITVIGTRTGSPFSGSGDIEIARLKMSKRSDITGPVSFSWDEKTKLGSKIEIQTINGSF